MSRQAAQDPNELFDVVTADGRPTGIVKRRAEVHRDGDWHRAVHVWVIGIDEEGPFITFQRRSEAKDTNPRKLDATVGGHYRSGETVEQTLREVEEEIGIAVELGDLFFAGVRVCVHEFELEAIDHELQDVFFLRDDRPLTGFRPNEAELAGLVRFRLPDAMEFYGRFVEDVRARFCGVGAPEIEEIRITRADTVSRIDRYAYRVCIAAERFLAGERHVSV